MIRAFEEIFQRMFSLIILILEITILATYKAMGVICVDDLVAIVMVVVFSISFIVTVQQGKVTKLYMNQLIAGYMIRVFLLFFDLFGKSIHTLPQSGADSSMFYRTSTELVLFGKTNRNGNFITFMYKVFSFIGINRLYGQFLLMLLSIGAIIVFILCIDRLMISEGAKTHSAWIICLLPNFALLSSLFLRESVVTFLITVSVYHMIIWLDEGNDIYCISAILLSAISCFFHSGSVGITIGCVACLLLYDNNEKRIHPTITSFVLTAIITIGLSFLFLRYGESLMDKFVGVESVSDIANTNSLGGSTYARYVGNSNNPINMVVYSIPRIAYFLFSPFPWQWRGVSDIIAFFFSGLYYLITIKNVILYFQRGNTKNQEKIICLLVIAFFCTFIFAWGVSNTGTASRHRDKMVCLYGVLYALTKCTSETNVYRKTDYCN